jgi:hypothetical protein
MIGARSTVPTVFHEVDGESHRRILAAANRFARMLGHADDGRGRMHRDARAHVGRRTRDSGFDDGRKTHEDQLEGRIGGERAQRAGNALRRTAVATHHIDGDRRHAPVLFSLRSRLRPASR